MNKKGGTIFAAALLLLCLIGLSSAQDDKPISEKERPPAKVPITVEAETPSAPGQENNTETAPGQENNTETASG
ncbi:MAG: hypothetical protein PHX20_07115, partial [Candidatus Omnitrophica bacterium]|nr:hypothetical protein [Candidatus Omnitrophota bacterium]